MAYTVEIIGDLSEYGKTLPTVNMVMTHVDVVFTLDTQSQKDKAHFKFEKMSLEKDVLLFCKKFGQEKDSNLFVFDLNQINTDEFVTEIMCFGMYKFATHILHLKRQLTSSATPVASSVDTIVTHFLERLPMSAISTTEATVSLPKEAPEIISINVESAATEISQPQNQRQAMW